jgi:hypothetical protein
LIEHHASGELASQDRVMMARMKGMTRASRWPPSRAVLVLGLMLAAGAAVLAVPPIAQDPAYHDMADQRALFGIPNSLNVLSNLPFAIVGVVGLAATVRRPGEGPSPFEHPWLRWPYVAVFGGALLTAFGSSYYHLSPDNARLVWDRLPMTLAFMGLVAAVVGERVSVSLSRRLLLPLLALGAGSVAYWYGSELRGAGDLRPYALVQFGSLLVVLLVLLLHRGRPADTRYLLAGLLAYAAAKGLEWADPLVYGFGQIVSGHTLKHLAAAAGLGCVAAMIWRRS